MNKLALTPAQFLIGVDGGGTGTRVVLADSQGRELARACAGPSGLAHGREMAWQAIQEACAKAFAEAGLSLPALTEVALGCGLAGVNNVQWAQEFIALNPGYAEVVTETDSYTNLLGAHGGAAGVVIALGTGSVGMVLQADGQRREVGGWGFPVGDEASGAWMGLQAMNYLQRTLDGRAQADEFSHSLLRFCGETKDAVFGWLAGANQTRYAQLAPIVIEFAQSAKAAREILQRAGLEVASMALALDATQTLPLALSGGLAEIVKPYVPTTVQQRIQRAQGDSVAGALLLIQREQNK